MSGMLPIKVCRNCTEQIAGTNATLQRPLYHSWNRTQTQLRLYNHILVTRLYFFLRARMG